MTPTPEQIKEARKSVDLTQAEAAARIHCALRSWQDWEAGKRHMHAAMWELFLIKTKARQAAGKD